LESLKPEVKALNANLETLNADFATNKTGSSEKSAIAKFLCSKREFLEKTNLSEHRLAYLFALKIR
jgi:hypothetical protein